MNTRLIEVHMYYKQMYHEALVIYRLEGRYAVLGEDCNRVSQYGFYMTEPGVTYFNDITDLLDRLSADNIEVTVIRYRNEAGQYDFPNVKLIAHEREMDL